MPDLDYQMQPQGLQGPEALQGPAQGQRELQAAQLKQRRNQLVAERSMRMERVTPKAVAQMYSYVNDRGILFKSGEPFSMNKESVELEGGVYHGSKSIGTWTRTWEKEPDGWIVYHNNFDLAPSINGKEGYQGQGIAKEWLEACEQRYLELGVKEVWTLANQVGGYTWARAGFEWAVPKHSNLEQELEKFKNQLEDNIGYALKSGEITREEEVLIRQKIDQYVTPQGVNIGALAAIETPGWKRPNVVPDVEETQDRAMGRKAGPRERSLGQTLLTDVEWHGVKRLGSE